MYTLHLCMYSIYDYIDLYNNLFTQLYARVGILLTHGKHLYERIISLREEVCSHKTSLPPALFNKVHISNQESERSCICVLGVRGHVFVC